MVSDHAKSKTEVVRRLHCVEGQVRNIVTMTECDDDFRSVIYQISAVQVALREINQSILYDHLITCLGELLDNTDMDSSASECYLTEVMSLYKLITNKAG